MDRPEDRSRLSMPRMLAIAIHMVGTPASAAIFFVSISCTTRSTSKRWCSTMVRGSASCISSASPAPSTKAAQEVIRASRTSAPPGPSRRASSHSIASGSAPEVCSSTIRAPNGAMVTETTTFAPESRSLRSSSRTASSGDGRVTVAPASSAPHKKIGWKTVSGGYSPTTSPRPIPRARPIFCARKPLATRAQAARSRRSSKRARCRRTPSAPRNLRRIARSAG